MERVKLIKLDQ